MIASIPESIQNILPKIKSLPEGFQACDNKPDFKTWKRVNPDKGLVEVRAEMVIDATPDAIMQCFRDPKLLMKSYSRAQNAEIVEKINENEDIFYMQMKTPMVISNRDMVTRRIFTEDVEGFKHILYHSSIVHEAKPPTKSFVRATLHDDAVAVKDGEKAGTSIVVVFTYMDMGGSIPTFIINSKATERMQMMKTGLAKVCATLN